MYELLNKLEIPDFGIDNWQSTIRHRAAVHDRYRNLTRWRGSETADIVYNDSEGALTRLLIEKGYLIGPAWSGCSPKFFIEVKTTTGCLDTAFFCSQPQYDRMERMQLLDNSPSDEVYLIARVFDLGASGMGLKLYLDPATLRRTEHLKFVAERYAVTPL